VPVHRHLILSPSSGAVGSRKEGNTRSKGALREHLSHSQGSSPVMWSYFMTRYTILQEKS